MRVSHNSPFQFDIFLVSKEFRYFHFCRKKRKEHRSKMWTRKLRIFFCFLACTLCLLFFNGCSKPYGLAETNSQGSAKVMVFENVQFSELLKATYETLDWAGLKVVEKIEQPKFNVLVIIARSEDVDSMKVRIRSLSETVHELILFSSTESGISKEQSFNRDFRQEIDKRLSHNLGKIK
jgi:hypothetical protein